MYVLLKIFTWIENTHQFSSLWDFEFYLTLYFTPLKYKRKKHYLFLALAATEENEVAEHTNPLWKRQSWKLSMKKSCLFNLYLLYAFSKSHKQFTEVSGYFS